MKKPILVLMVLVMIFCFSACGGESEATPENPVDTTEPTATPGSVADTAEPEATPENPVSAAEPEVDYSNEVDFEKALNNGEDLIGKTVTFTPFELVPDSAFGYNLQAGEHLNFCSINHPGVSAGDTVTVKVLEVNSMLGSYIISYEMIE